MHGEEGLGVLYGLVSCTISWLGVRWGNGEEGYWRREHNKERTSRSKDSGRQPLKAASFRNVLKNCGQEELVKLLPRFVSKGEGSSVATAGSEATSTDVTAAEGVAVTLADANLEVTLGVVDC